MSAAIDTIRMIHAESNTRSSPLGSVFTKTSKHGYETRLPKMASQTSLLDVIRSQGHAMLQDPAQIRMMQAELKEPRQPKSEPIRIVASQGHDEEDAVDEDLLSSSAELERFYDQATWRMYILIQSARLANEAAMGKPSHNRVPVTPHSQAPYHHPTSSHRTVHNNNSSSRLLWTTQCPAAVEAEEEIFDFEL